MSSLTFENQRETLVVFLNSISFSDGRIDQFSRKWREIQLGN